MASYGSWITCTAKDLPEAKRLLAREMLCMMEQLAESDDFWEITQLPMPTACGEDLRIGYKISIPYMDVK